MKKNPETSAGRRSFLKAGAGFLGATLFGGIPFRSFAASTDLKPADRCFVFVYFSGGWDQLLAFDPRDPTEFTAERVSETRILPGYSFTDARFPSMPIRPDGSNISFGPAVGDLSKHYDLMTVVRGINMTTLAHEEGMRYFITGKRPIGAAARGSSTATEVVGQMMPKVPIASIAMNVESYNEGYGGYANALRVNNRNDLLLTLGKTKVPLDSELENQLLDFNGRPVTCEEAAYGAGGVGTTYANSRGQMKQVLDSGLDTAFDFAHASNEALRAQYGLSASNYDQPMGRAALVATALKKGISQCVSINLATGLDTHFGSQTTHATNQRTGFDALAMLVEDLQIGRAHV